MKKEKETTATREILIIDKGIKDKDQLLGVCCFGPIFPILA